MRIEYLHASKYGNGVMVAEGKVRVTDVKGPLEEGWQHKVEAFAARIPVQG